MRSSGQAVIRNICISVLLSLFVFASGLKADGKKWIILQETLPDTAKKFSIKLNYQPSSSRFYDEYKSNLKSTPIESRKKDAYKQQIDLGPAIDGYRYIVQVKEATDAGLIGDDSNRMCMVKVARSKDNKKFETVKEGLLSFHQDLDIPLNISPEAAGVPSDKPITGNLEINISSNNRSSVYEGRCRTTLNGSLSGSTTTEAATLHASLTSSDSLAVKRRTLSLSAQPHNDRMGATSGKGKLTDTIKLGSAKIVVEKILADSSEIVLAVLSGELVTPKQKIESLAEIGKPFPPFARVELIKRQLFTLDNLKKEAGPDGHIVLVFGDFKIPTTNRYGGPQMGLSLEANMIEKILNKDCEKPAILVFVCQQLSLSDLYGKWIDGGPDFYILANHSNPMMTQFLGGQIEPHMIMQRRPNQGETLRGQLRFEPNKIVTTLINAEGQLLYLNADAGNELSASLVQINALIREARQVPQ